MTDQDVSGDDPELARLKHAAFSRGATDADLRRLAEALAARAPVSPPPAAEPDEAEAPVRSRRWMVAVAAVVVGVLAVTGVATVLQDAGRAPVDEPGVAGSTSAPSGGPSDSAPVGPPAGANDVPDEDSPLTIFDRPATPDDATELDLEEAMLLEDADSRRIAEIEGIPVYVVRGTVKWGAGEIDDVVVVCLYADSGADPEYSGQCVSVDNFDGDVLSLALTGHVVRWGLTGIAATVSERG